MARPSKKALDWFKKDVNYYDDDKIMDLLDEYGPLGQTVYDVALTLIYKNGYYLEIPIDKLVSLIYRTIGNRWIKNKCLVLQVIHYCADIGLFDKDLLSRNVMTSVGIQRRYSEVTTRNKVDKNKYWLLEKNEVRAALETVPDNPVSATETPIFDTETRVNETVIPQEKIRVDKIKSRCVPSETTVHTNTYGKQVRLTESEYANLVDQYGKSVIDEYIGKIDSYLENSGKKPFKNHFDTIKKWLEKDGVQPKSAHSYDLDLLMEHAMNTVPEFK